MFSRTQAHANRRFATRAALIGLLVILAGLVLGATTALGATFNPALVISDDNMRAYDSMSASDIQAFLNTQTGPLKSLVTTDYTGVRKPAAQIIYDASVAWHISPKVMLTMLQKEQSLLTRTSLSTNTLSRAIGAGCPNSYTNKYPGFGKQMYYGARLLDGYGEGKNGSTIPVYRTGIVVWDRYQNPDVAVYPANLATYKLYIYNPSIGAKVPYGDLSTQSCSGNANFWKIYWRYFGDPLEPIASRAVYRFQKRSNGAWLYTSSVTERYKLITRSASTYRYKGVAFSWSTTSTVNARNVYRFYNKLNGTYLYTRSSALKTKLTSWAYRRTWSYQGVPWKDSGVATAQTVPVYMFYDVKGRCYFYTSKLWEKNKYSGYAYRYVYRYRGIGFYIDQ